ncbi:MAG: hypothetical protein F6K03_08895, partial [Kamptonema sp. SIO4C4]|nr:hypothetical protein [Kamptonema sp. SIO4C4]
MLPKTFILQAAKKFNISKRELEVLTRALEGESVQDLAQELGVTKAALQKRLGEVYNKFDIGGGRGPGKLARLQQKLMEEYQKHTSQQPTPSTHPSTIDWGNTPHPQPIYGRQSEIQQLQEIILTQKPALVGIWGMPGIGKTALGVRLLQHLAPEFQQGIWRDFSHLNEIIPTLTPQTLLIIDNWQGDKTSLKPLKAGCIILLSRTPFGEEVQESLHLEGLSDDAVRLWVEQQGLSPDE